MIVQIARLRIDDQGRTIAETSYGDFVIFNPDEYPGFVTNVALVNFMPEDQFARIIPLAKIQKSLG